MYRNRAGTKALQRLWLSAMAAVLIACCCMIANMPIRASGLQGGTLHVHYQFYKTDADYIEDLVVFDVPVADDGSSYHVVDDDAGYSLEEAASWRVMKNFSGGEDAGEEEITAGCSLDAERGILEVGPEWRGEDVSLVVQLPWNSAAHSLKRGFESLSGEGSLAQVMLRTAMAAPGFRLSAQGAGNSGIGNLDIGVEYPLKNIRSVFGNAGDPIRVAQENVPHISGIDSSDLHGGAVHGYPENDREGSTKYCFYVAFEENNSELFEICGVPGRQGSGGSILCLGEVLMNYDWTVGYKWVTGHCVENVINGGGNSIPIEGPGTWVRIDSVEGNTINCTYRITCVGPRGEENQDIMGSFSLENPKGALSIHKESTNPSISEGNGLFGLHGIMYGVFSDRECTNEVASITLDSNGNGIAENLQVGTYWIKETVSNGYFMDGTVYEATVSGGNTTAVNGGVLGDVPGSVDVDLLLVKTDKDSQSTTPQGNATLAGARFTVKYFGNLDGSVAGAPKRSWVLKSDGEGRVRVDEEHFVSGDSLYRNESGGTVLPFGTYLITETTPPDGYKLPEDGGARIVVLGERNASAGTIAHTSYEQEDAVARGGFMIGKGDIEGYDNEDGTYYNYAQGDSTFADAEFTVYNESSNRVMVGGSWHEPGSAIMTLATDYDAAIDAYVASTGEKALPFGTYRIVETKAPKGYRGSGQIERTVRITEDGQFTQLVENDGMLNEIVLGGVKVAKHDAELGAGEAIGGAGHEDPDLEGYRGTSLSSINFTIANVSEHGVCVGGSWYSPGEDVATISTQWNEEEGDYTAQTASEFLPYGTYTIQETATNDCYLLTDGEPKTFEIRNHGKVVTVDTGGEALVFSDLVIRHDMHLQKKADGSQARLANVPFLITNVTTGEAHVAVTDSNGVLNTSANWQKHTSNTNANDALAGADSIASADIVKNAGVWFGLGEGGSVAPPDDGRGALPFGDYTIRELRCEANAGYSLWEDGFSIGYDTTQTPFDVDLGTIYDKPGEIIGTQAADVETGTNAGTVSQSCRIVDNVRYENVSVGKEYKIVGTLMNRETGEPVIVDGEAVTATTLFTPTTSSGTAKVRFELDSSSLAGTPTVVFERLYESDTLVTTHEDLGNEDQSIDFNPAIGTKAADAADGDGFISPDGMQTIVDTVSYEGLVPGTEYTVIGTLMDPETSRPLRISGKSVTVEKAFRPNSASGTIGIEFSFDASKLAGRSTVVFEKLLLEGSLVASHEDPGDEDQTIRFPEISTSAADKADGDQHLGIEGMQTIVDDVSFIGLAPGREYALEGTLMDISTGKPIMSGDSPVTATSTFVAEAEDGSAAIEFEVDAASLAGKTVVVFERLSSGGSIVATHEDLEDLGQTVGFPAIGTKAVDKSSGTSAIRPNAEVTVIDTVSYSGLIPGQEYLVSGMLVDKATGKEVLSEKKIVAAEKTFVPEQGAGSIDVEFTFDTTGLNAGQKLVAFERVAYKGATVAVHADIGDAEQTVIVSAKDAPVPVPVASASPSSPAPTGRASSLAKTGDASSLLLLIVIGVMLTGTCAAIYALQRPLKRRDADE